MKGEVCSVGFFSKFGWESEGSSVSVEGKRPTQIMWALKGLTFRSGIYLKVQCGSW